MVKPTNIQTHILSAFRTRMPFHRVVSEKFFTIHYDRMRMRKTMIILEVYIITKIVHGPQFVCH